VTDTNTSHRSFSGNPARYRRITLVFPLVFNLVLYLGMVAIIWGVQGEDWILGWKPLLSLVLMSAFYIRVAYPWIMGLDARFGKGSGWKLESQSIKLPERR